MTDGLRVDIIRAFENARALVVGGGGDAGRIRAAITWIDGFTRFLASDPEIEEGRRAAMSALDALAEQLSEAEPDPRGVSKARAAVSAELASFESTILRQGCANELADRVGLGIAGRPI